MQTDKSTRLFLQHFILIVSAGILIGCNSQKLEMEAAASSLAENKTPDDGLVVIEAESFADQRLNDKRQWFIFNQKPNSNSLQDADPQHTKDASGESYIEALPDTRITHQDPLKLQENFTDQAGTVAVLSYPTYFTKPGIYYVWARAYSTGSEDNGVHIGLNGEWPESGQRLQLCQGKHQWTWSSAQRIPSNHCGSPNTITLNIPTSGMHNVMVSMREDGFELDKLLLTTDKHYTPAGQGPSGANP